MSGTNLPYYFQADVDNKLKALELLLATQTASNKGKATIAEATSWVTSNSITDGVMLYIVEEQEFYLVNNSLSAKVEPTGLKYTPATSNIDDVNQALPAQIAAVKEVRDQVNAIKYVDGLGVVESSDVTLKNTAITSISEDGDVLVTQENSKSYPWWFCNTDKLQFTYSSNVKYLVIAQNDSSVIEIGITGGGAGSLLKFTDEDSFSGSGITAAVTVHTNNSNPTAGDLIILERVDTLITVTINDVLRYSIDFSGDTNPEFNNPVFGVIVDTDNFILNNVSVNKQSERLSAIENTVLELDIATKNLVKEVDNSKNDIDALKILSDEVDSIKNTEGLLNIESSDITLKNTAITSISEDGDVLVTQENSKSYPWWFCDTDRLEFTYSSNVKYLVIAQNDSSVIEIGITGGGAGSLLKFTDEDSFSGSGITAAVTVHTNNSNPTAGDLIILERVDTLITVTINDVLRYSIDFSGDTNPEFNNPVFGVIADTDNFTLNNVSINKQVDRLDKIEKSISELDEKIESSENATETQLYDGLTLGGLGDSILASGTAFEIIQTALGLASYENLAVSGSGIVRNGGLGLTKMTELTAGHKLILSNYGTNDFGTDQLLGVESDEVAGTFYGAADVYFKYLRENNPTAFIFQCTIMHRDWQGAAGQATGLVNTNGDSIEDFNNALKLKAAKYGIIIIDLYRLMGVSKENIDTYHSDRLHLTTTGYNRMTGIIIKAIKNHTYFID